MLCLEDKSNIFQRTVLFSVSGYTVTIISLWDDVLVIGVKDD
jgi:hypothetical protein